MILGPIAKIVAGLYSNRRPGEVGAAVATAVLLTIIPGGNLLWFMLLFVVFLVRINHAVTLVLLALLAPLSSLLDPLLHGIGHAVLTHPSLAHPFTPVLRRRSRRCRHLRSHTHRQPQLQAKALFQQVLDDHAVGRLIVLLAHILLLQNQLLHPQRIRRKIKADGPVRRSSLDGEYFKQLKRRILYYNGNNFVHNRAFVSSK